jgi:Domain of unknown function (DUF1844)
MADTDEKSSGFTVTDRRSFDAVGEPKPETQQTAKAGPQGAPAAKLASAAPPQPEVTRALPPADFATLVLSLGSSVVMYLGESPDGRKVERNLPMAKHAIDLLTVLEEKTKGNLSAEEEHILGSLLFDLRLRYVEVLKEPAAGG